MSSPSLRPPLGQTRRLPTTRNIVTRSGGGLRGFFSSSRFPALIPFEGATEKETLILLDFSCRVLNVTAQPFRDQFQHESKRTHRTPDFLVETTNGLVILECKTARQLEREETRAYLQVAAQHFKQLGEKYLVITDQTLRQGAALRNALWLEPFRPKGLMTPVVERALSHAKDVLIPELPCPVVQAYARLENQVLVKALIASRAVHIDFSKPIDDATILHPTILEEPQDASFFLFSGSALQME